MQVDQLYQEIILDHYKHPHGRGLREPYAAEAHHVNPTCGDEVTIRVALDDDTLSDVSYDGMGCSISQASASVLHELLTGRDTGQAFAVHAAFVELMSGRGQVTPEEELLGDAVAFAGVARYPARVKCALLPWMAFKDAAARAGVDVEAGNEDSNERSEVKTA
ncbi:SUF system NifU family Fe-S cluster assembly protein [Plantactinospora mayteni]|uniref:Iron-sulfur cluster assembly scaffold protein NifU n=1 Tax=Plantactinospora mayteni TaxID=566021 RepID=A0ABQ4F2G8_9ACTN|nr:SUF system NifU family Fe-S cluster assembly protein [Plantactinospora mayteni]GIH01101.1 iron-sulfur cluster assembly scaffold protein NifU [Plantactinospora mayteni]